MSWFKSQPSKDTKVPPPEGHPKLEPVKPHHVCTPVCAEHARKEAEK